VGVEAASGRHPQAVCLRSAKPNAHALPAVGRGGKQVDARAGEARDSSMSAGCTINSSADRGPAGEGRGVAATRALVPWTAPFVSELRTPSQCWARRDVEWRSRIRARGASSSGILHAIAVVGEQWTSGQQQVRRTARSALPSRFQTVMHSRWDETSHSSGAYLPGRVRTR